MPCVAAHNARTNPRDNTFYWHCPHRMRSRDYVTVRCPSVRVSPSIGPQQQTRCCRFAALGPAGGRYRLIAARVRRSVAAAGECGRCHVVSVTSEAKHRLIKQLTVTGKSNRIIETRAISMYLFWGIMYVFGCVSLAHPL